MNDSNPPEQITTTPPPSARRSWEELILQGILTVILIIFGLVLGAFSGVIISFAAGWIRIVC